MTGNTWIIIGVIAAALAAFAIPYGFYRKSSEGSAKSEKTVMNQTAEVRGDFIEIVNFLESGSTGVFVNLILNVANFVGERTSIGESASVDDYLKWLQKQCKQDLVNGHRSLLDVLERQDKQATLVRECIETVILLVEDQRNRLREIVEQTQLLPNMDSKLDYLIHQLSKKDSSTLREGQLAISARVLDILTAGIVGSGAKVMMGQEINAHEGTAMVVWLLGIQSPHMMLLDLVGDVNMNRLSVILNEDASITLRVYDGGSSKIELKSKGYSPGHRLVILAVWKDQNMSLWINGESQGCRSMSKAFDYLGPVCLFGIDIEGKLSADAVRWTPQGQEVGLNLMKNGIWHGSRFDTVMIWDRPLEKSDISVLAEDPWVMFRWGDTE
jgi:hypothetical protein